jgi:glycerol-3-phosphate O-acyltransferase
MGKREKHSPQAIGAHFAQVQKDMGGKLMETLRQAVCEYAAGQEAEYKAMIEGYGEQALSLYEKGTAKTRKSEFKRVADAAAKSETRQTLLTIMPSYSSVQKLAADLRKLEKGTAEIDEEGKVKPIKAEKAEGEGETEGEEVVVKVDSQPAMIDTLEKVMQAVYDAGYLKAADLIQQAMASIGRGEKE